LTTFIECFITGRPDTFTSVNGPDNNFPYVGGIVGFFSANNDLAAGSYHYAYWGGTVQTPVDSPPVSGGNSFTAATGIPEAIESAIWPLSGANELTAQWINTDLSTPATYIARIQDVLLLTGDLTAFSNTFGPTVVVTLAFVSTSGPCIIPLPDPCATAVPTSGCTVNGVPNQPCQGGLGNDTITGANGNDVIRGGGGNDILRGQQGNDLLCGEAGSDILTGDQNDDTLVGGSGNDTLRGEEGADGLFGGDNDDILDGGAGKDLFANGETKVN
jgi:hypothetical protein